MAQSNIGTINPITYTGGDLAAALPLMEQAIHSGHKGAARPAYAVAGMIWVKAVSAARSEIMYFDGDHDHMVLAVNPATNAVIDAAAFLRNAENLNAGILPHARLPKADQSEAEAGTSASKVMTPQRVKQAIEALRATQAEAEAGTSASRLMTPERVKQAIEAADIDADQLDSQDGSFYRNAGNLSAGTVPLARLPVASQAEAEAGTSYSKLMTPKRVKQAIEAITPAEYESGQLSLILSAKTTLIHGLTHRPKRLEMYLICQVAHLGYPVGAEVRV